MINHYEVLGLGQSASPEEIKTAYRQLAKLHHPDRDGGNAERFARIQQAYEVLSDQGRREAFDLDLLHTQRARTRTRARRERGSGGRTAPRAAPRTELTRLISLALPRGGRFQLQGLMGSVTINPTTPENLWETTLKKFGRADLAQLAESVIQLKLVGQREVVEALYPHPTETGIAFPGPQGRLVQQAFAREGALGGAWGAAGFRLGLAPQPLQVIATVPRGITLHLEEILGNLTLGELGAELVCTLHHRNELRAGHLTRARLTLTGNAMAYLARVEGDVDVVAVDAAKVLLDGAIVRLRAQVENQGHVEVLCPVTQLQATVRGRGFLHVKAAVREATCDVHTGGYVRLAELATPLQGRCTGGGLVDVLAARRPRSMA